MSDKESKKSADLEFIRSKSLWLSIQFAIFALAIAFTHTTVKFIAYFAISALWYTVAIYASRKYRRITKNNTSPREASCH